MVTLMEQKGNELVRQAAGPSSLRLCRDDNKALALPPAHRHTKRQSLRMGEQEGLVL